MSSVLVQGIKAHVRASSTIAIRAVSHTAYASSREAPEGVRTSTWKQYCKMQEKLVKITEKVHRLGHFATHTEVPLSGRLHSFSLPDGCKEHSAELAAAYNLLLEHGKIDLLSLPYSSLLTTSDGERSIHPDLKEAIQSVLNDPSIDIDQFVRQLCMLRRGRISDLSRHLLTEEKKAYLAQIRKLEAFMECEVQEHQSWKEIEGRERQTYRVGDFSFILNHELRTVCEEAYIIVERLACWECFKENEVRWALLGGGVDIFFVRDEQVSTVLAMLHESLSSSPDLLIEGLAEIVSVDALGWDEYVESKLRELEFTISERV